MNFLFGVPLGLLKEPIHYILLQHTQNVLSLASLILSSKIMCCTSIVLIPDPIHSCKLPMDSLPFTRFN